MSLRETIRKRMTERMRGPRSSKWDYSTHPESSELNDYLLKSGYALEEVVLHSGSVELVIRPRTPGYLHPEITHDITDNVFYVQVKEYGLLESSDLEEIISGYNTALSVVRYLERLNLEVIRSENESR